MNWFIFALLSPLFWGIENYISKIVALRGFDSKKVTIIFSATVCLLSFIAMLFMKEPVVNWQFLLFITSFASVTFFISMILRLNVLKVIDASVLYPFHKIVNLAVLVGMSLLLLGERLSPLQIIGLLVIVPAIYHLYDAPSVKKKIMVTPFIIAAVSAFLSAVSNYSADVATQTIKVFTFGFFTYLVGFIFTLVLSFFQREKNKKGTAIFTKELVSLSVIMGVFNFAGFCFFFLALFAGPLALVGGLNNLSLVVTILLSLIILKEPLTKNRLIGIGLSIISLYLLQ